MYVTGELYEVIISSILFIVIVVPTMGRRIRWVADANQHRFHGVSFDSSLNFFALQEVQHCCPAAFVFESWQMNPVKSKEKSSQLLRFWMYFELTYFPSHHIAWFRPSNGSTSVLNLESFEARYLQNCSCERTGTILPSSSTRRVVNRLGKTQQGTTTNGFLYCKAASTIASVAPSACNPRIKVAFSTACCNSSEMANEWSSNVVTNCRKRELTVSSTKLGFSALCSSSRRCHLFGILGRTKVSKQWTMFAAALGWRRMNTGLFSLRAAAWKERPSGSWV